MTGLPIAFLVWTLALAILRDLLSSPYSWSGRNDCTNWNDKGLSVDVDGGCITAALVQRDRPPGPVERLFDQTGAEQFIPLGFDAHERQDRVKGHIDLFAQLVMPSDERVALLENCFGFIRRDFLKPRVMEAALHRGHR